MRIYLSIYLYLQPYKGIAHVYQFQHLHFRCTQLILCTNRRIRNVFVLNWACVHYELYLPMYCIVFAFVYFKLYAREREREGEWRWTGMYGGLLPPLQFRFCSSIVAKSRIQHVHTFCWANKFRLSCLTNFDGLATWWISTLHVCFDSLPIISRVQLNWARHTQIRITRMAYGYSNSYIYL